ncbi:5-oxoprolinase subunit PxpA [Aerococcaceae bacterium zg-BR22]|uniref:LamB/YcsF family protein n=1 Tax=Aerococcaceae bacterium zg-1292 TaxID=2774330 RepID=UPI004063EF9D|nr:5-oxoprolinase subunit PxpA [Aerococcaceae bacterium zg-BR22]
MWKVDLNADLGESFGAYTIGQDEKLAPLISSANIACGFHAGDPLVMSDTVGVLKEASVALGAHPGLPDIQGFGRRQMAITPKEAKAYMLYQLGALAAIAKANGTHLQHVKPHGALYNMAATNYDLALALAQAVAEFDGNLIFLGLSGSEMIRAAEDCGLTVASEVFADRGYNDDGTLVPRHLPGAMIEDEAEAIARVIKMVKSGTVTSVNGKEVAIQADSICVHGDGEKALAFVAAIRAACHDEGIEIVALDSVVVND